MYDKFILFLHTLATNIMEIFYGVPRLQQKQALRTTPMSTLESE